MSFSERKIFLFPSTSSCFLLHSSMHKGKKFSSHFRKLFGFVECTRNVGSLMIFFRFSCFQVKTSFAVVSLLKMKSLLEFRIKGFFSVWWLKAKLCLTIVFLKHVLKVFFFILFLSKSDLKSNIFATSYGVEVLRAFRYLELNYWTKSSMRLGCRFQIIKFLWAF